MAIDLQVPFVSQNGKGANLAWGDCTVACANMLMRYFLKWGVPVDTMTRRTILRTQPRAGLSLESAVVLLGTFGLLANIFRYRDLDVLKINLAAGYPMIVEFPSTPQNSHACVVRGYDEQSDRWKINNPVQGQYTLTSAQMKPLFSLRGGTCYGVRACGTWDHVSAIFAYPPQQFANVRDFYALRSTVVSAVKSGQVIQFRISSAVAADGYHWVRLEDGRGWVALEVV